MNPYRLYLRPVFLSSFLLAAMTVMSGSLLKAQHSGDMEEGISERITGRDDLYISYLGGNLTAGDADGIYVDSGLQGSGAAYIGYDFGKDPLPISGSITSNARGIAVQSAIASSANVLNDAKIVSGGTSIFLSLPGDAMVDNGGDLESTGGDGINIQTSGSGSITVKNRATVHSTTAASVSLTSVSGDISLVNEGGSISGRTNGLYASSTSGRITLINTGSLLIDGGLGLYANTASEIHIENSGHIEGGTGSFGIFVGTSVTGGNVINTGRINFADSINIQGSNVRLTLGQGSSIGGDISIVTSGNSNTLVTGTIRHEIGGQLMMGGANLELTLDGENSYGALVTVGYTDISGATLILKVSGAIAEGTRFTIMESESMINGFFLSLPDETVFYAGDADEYGFKIFYEYDEGGGTVKKIILEATTTVIPEASTYATIAGALALLFVIFMRRRRS